MGGGTDDPAWKKKPSWFLVAERDRIIAPETQRFMAHRAGSHILAAEVDHTPLATAPDGVVPTITEVLDAATQEAAFDPQRIGPRP